MVACLPRCTLPRAVASCHHELTLTQHSIFNAVSRPLPRASPRPGCLGGRASVQQRTCAVPRCVKGWIVRSLRQLQCLSGEIFCVHGALRHDNRFIHRYCYIVGCMCALFPAYVSWSRSQPRSPTYAHQGGSLPAFVCFYYLNAPHNVNPACEERLALLGGGGRRTCATLEF